jgi:hypothetical protein
MRQTLGLVIGGLVFTSLGWSAQKASTMVSAYTDATYGFTIHAPSFPKATRGTVVPLMMYAPPEDQFATNVNVGVQSVQMSRKAYRDASVAQFQKLGFKINSERNTTVSGKDAIFWDYEGTMAGRSMRFLALAVMDRDRVIVATGTALRENFPRYEPAFRTCLDSFRITR